MNTIAITGGRVIDPARGVNAEGDVYVVDGRVADRAAYERARAAGAGAAPVDARGLWVVPGLIDVGARVHTLSRDPWSACAGELKSAAAGGFAVVAPAPDTDPVNDDPAVTTRVRAIEIPGVTPRVLPIGALTRDLAGDELAPVGLMRGAEAVAVGDLRRAVPRAGVFRRALEYAWGLGIRVIVEPRDGSLEGEGTAHEGLVATRLGLRGLPDIAESIAVDRDATIAAWVGAPLHFHRITAAIAVAAVRRHKAAGAAVTAGTTAAHLYFTDAEVAAAEGAARLSAPLREESDRAALIAALCDRTLDVVISDHTPLVPDDKDVEFEAATPGAHGFETAAAALTTLVAGGVLSPLRAVELLSTNPARVLGLNRAGRLALGDEGHVTLIDPACGWTVDPERFVSCSRHTLFAGMRLTGRPVLTITSGSVVFNGLR